MLIQLLLDRPQVIGQILANTPPWVGGLAVGLAALGISQLKDRTVSIARVTVMPLAMNAFSLWGTASAFGSSPHFGSVMLAWSIAAIAMLALIGLTPPATGTHYQRASRSFAIPGSWVPLVLIAAIFLTKYTVGVDLVMQPSLASDGRYTLVVATFYGIFSGIFAGRAARLWRLALRPASRFSPLTA